MQNNHPEARLDSKDDSFERKPPNMGMMDVDNILVDNVNGTATNNYNATSFKHFAADQGSGYDVFNRGMARTLSMRNNSLVMGLNYEQESRK